MLNVSSLNCKVQKAVYKCANDICFYNFMKYICRLKDIRCLI